MKNTIHLLILSLTIILFSSCSQSELEHDNKAISPIFENAFELQSGFSISPHEVSLENGRINFHSLDAFENLASNTANQDYVAQFKSLIQEQGDYRPDQHASTYVEEDKDDYLGGFLFNSDGILQVENLIFKVDAKEQAIRFLPADKLEQLPALINGSDGADIQSQSAQYLLGLDNEMSSGSLPVVCWMCIVGSITTQQGDIGGTIVTRLACALCKVQLGNDDEEDQKR